MSDQLNITAIGLQRRAHLIKCLFNLFFHQM